MPTTNSTKATNVNEDNGSDNSEENTVAHTKEKNYFYLFIWYLEELGVITLIEKGTNMW